MSSLKPDAHSLMPILVIASHNAGKVAEFDRLLAPLNFKVISAAEAQLDEPEETGSTFAENATLKAEHAAAATGLAALADDSGLVIPGISGQPGIYSARWAGPGKDFSVAFARIQKELLSSSPLEGEAGRGVATREGFPLGHPLPNPPLKGEGIHAYFICTLALKRPNSPTELFEGRIDGVLTFPPRGEAGFGYDPIFIPEGYDITFAQIDSETKNRISHRARAFAKFLDYLKAHA